MWFARAASPAASLAASPTEAWFTEAWLTLGPPPAPPSLPQGDPEVCASCAGTGGIKCFACEGSGKTLGVSREALAAAARQRDPLGGSRNQRECVACKGAGKIFCKNCSGSGFSRHM